MFGRELNLLGSVHSVELPVTGTGQADTSQRVSSADPL